MCNRCNLSTEFRSCSFHQLQTDHMEIATRILNHTDVMMSLLGLLPPFLPKSINKFRTFIQDKIKGGGGFFRPRHVFNQRSLLMIAGIHSRCTLGIMFTLRFILMTVTSVVNSGNLYNFSGLKVTCLHQIGKDNLSISLTGSKFKRLFLTK